MGYVYLAPRDGSNKISLNGYNHLTWRYKMIPLIRTDNCTDMSNMFSGANYSLPETLDLRAFNTSHVITMHSMFDNCKSETILGLENFNTTNVTDMAYMFNSSKATELDLSSFDTSKVTTMENMFCNSEVEDLDISSFDTSLVTNMSCMFEGVTASIDTSSFDTSEVTTMHNMFKGTSGTTLDLSNFDTSDVIDMSSMFQNASYNSIDVSSFNTSSVANMSGMFRGSTELNLDVSNFDFGNVTDVSYMFGGANYQIHKTLNSLTLPSNFDTSNITNITGLFYCLTIPNLDLRGIEFESAETQQNLFAGLTTNTLDISDWDLGEHATATAPSWYPYSSQYFYESIFSGAQIQDLRLSNSNNFPEGYRISSMFNSFKTNGTLDISKLHFDKATNTQGGQMFSNAKINTLIMGNITRNEFANDLREDSGDTGNYSSFFYKTVVELLDMSSSLIAIGNGNSFFDGIIATRINMPNQICVELSEYEVTYASYGRAKYVDYSSVDTTNADYTTKQWEYMSKYVTRYNKVVWIPSTFILDGNRTMNSFLTGDIYTDALSYSALGWDSEPKNVTMHYGATHSDFEQAILNDDSDEWVSPLGYPLFYCYTSVPLNTTMKKAQFESDNYNEVYYDNSLIDDPNNFTFTETGVHTLKIIVNGYEYTQKVTVVDHGSTYTVVGTPKDYIWDSTNKTYTYSTSDKVSCRLYPDKYLFLYTDKRVIASVGAYTAIESTPNTTITKVSGAPFLINRITLSGCTQLTDISELIIINPNNSRGFDPRVMFYNCTNLSDFSVINKWYYTTGYNYYERYSSSYVTTRYDSYAYNSTFYNTHITTAPKINLTPSSQTFYNCQYLTDISKLGAFTSGQGTYSSSSGISFNQIFQGCSRLSNVDRLKYALTAVRSYVLNLNSFLANTAITNTNFIPDDGINVINIAGMFSGCTSLTDLSGMSRVRVTANGYFYNTFSGTPATDYSPLSNWTTAFSNIYFDGTKIANLSFMADWDLSRCVYYNFSGSTNLTSLSVLSGKIITTEEISINLSNCTSLTSLVGLEGCIFSTSGTYFNGCTSLTSLNGLQGCTIKDCAGLFSGCTSLSDITALSQVTFSDITNINSMFSGCTALVSLNGLQGLDISNCTQLQNVFFGCTSLSNLDAISGWRPYQVKNIQNLFRGCSSLTSVAALRNWITDQLTNMNWAFYGCSSLSSLNGLVGFNPGQCTQLQYVFYGCTALTDILDIQYWYVARCTYMQYTFQNCTSLTDITPLANWNVSALQNTQYMFQNCTSLESIAPLANWNISSLSNMSYMFDGDIAITDADNIDVWKNKRTMTSVTRIYAFRNVPRPWPSWAQS